MIIFEKLHEQAKIPTRATARSAGFDVYALDGGACPSSDKVVIRTGIKCALHDNVCFQVWPRSSLAVEHDIDVQAGLIDSDYRGEIKIVLRNHSLINSWRWEAGQRIAQLVPVVLYAGIAFEDRVDGATSRGEGGFGSTGN